jgi:hypothetical protein
MPYNHIKKISVVIVSGLLLIYATLAGAKTEREKADLIGQVRSVVQEEGTWKKGSRVFSHSATYDIKGRMLKMEISFYRVGSSKREHKSKSISTYDSKKNRRETVLYGEEGTPTEKRVATFEANGNETESTTYNDKGSVKYRFVHKYDLSGNETEVVSYRSDGSIILKIVNTYDEKGNLKEVTAYKTDQTVDYRVVNTYDKQGNMIESIIYKADGSLEEKRTYTYNENGYEKEKIVYNPNGSMREKETYDYEFDSVGNWIKKTTKKWVPKEGKLEAEVPYIVKRTITYYEGKK